MGPGKEEAVKFTKMHGCGNDYIYVNGFEEKVKDPSKAAVTVSDRHFGIGSDGLIIIQPSDVADCRMEMYNADGSQGKMCGNGIRCVAKYVYDNGMVKKDRITVETLSGIKTLDLNVRNGKVKTVRVDMGSPVLTPEKVPVSLGADQEKLLTDTDFGQILLNAPYKVGGQDFRITAVSMGNPHCVVPVDDPYAMKLEVIGPLFEHNVLFPEGVNTEFIRVQDRENVRMRVWERGSGETWACGTGACAVGAACILNGWTDRTLTVHLRGGDLLIEWERQKNTIFMTGPAVTVFDGEIDI